MIWPPTRWLGMAAVLLLAAGRARAGERTMVTLGTATPGGGFPVYAQARETTGVSTGARRYFREIGLSP